MHIKTQYSGKLRTEVTHLKSNTNIITDAPTDNHGLGQSFSPTDLVAGSLASCMLTIMGIEANKQGFDLGNVEATTEKIMKKNPRAISAIRIKFSWPDCDLDENTRKHLKEKALTCPVALSIHPDIRQEISFDF